MPNNYIINHFTCMLDLNLSLPALKEWLESSSRPLLLLLQLKQFGFWKIVSTT